MNLQFRPPARSKHTLLGAGALTCYVAAIVLAPAHVRSQLDGRLAKETVQPPARVEPLPAAVSPDGDAFAPRATIDDDPSPAPPPSAPQPLPRLLTAPNVLARPLPLPLPSTHVTAIATGTQPTAIVDSGGTTRVVGVGDALDGSTIERIDQKGIALADGRQLLLEPASSR